MSGQPMDEETRNQLSLQALARGELPLRAQERISKAAAGAAEAEYKFTSDLTVNEFLAIRECGFEPVSQVMGSSVYQIAWVGQCMAAGTWGSFATTPMDFYAQAMSHARRLALGRMAQETAGVGGHGVVGVHLTWRYIDQSNGLMEFTAIGTAIRRRGSPALGKPFLSSLSGQQFAKVFRNGYMPCGLVIGMSAYQIHPGWGTRSQQQSWSNQEMGQYTQAVTAARHSAVSGLYQDLQTMGADGCVGMTVALQMWEWPCYYYRGSEKEELEDKVVQFSAVGTAVVRYSTDRDFERIGIVRRLDDSVESNVEVEV